MHGPLNVKFASAQQAVVSLFRLLNSPVTTSNAISLIFIAILQFLSSSGLLLYAFSIAPVKYLAHRITLISLPQHEAVKSSLHNVHVTVIYVSPPYCYFTALKSRLSPSLTPR